MNKNITHTQPWLSNKYTEFVFIILPPFLCVALIALFPSYFISTKELNDYTWVILILLIDVAHVYSTLYRTYFDKTMWQQSRTLLYAIPLVAFLLSVIVYSLSSFWFWRILAYVAVFHFIRQQYGFMRLYSRNECNTKTQIIIDKIIVYYATIYPIIFWHCSDDRNFNWFTENDFIQRESPGILFVASALYYLMLLTFVMYYSYLFIVKKQCNLPKILIIIGTIASWFFGIVYFNGDLTFTLLNVVSHGIPYMALIWLFAQKQHQQQPTQSSIINKKVFAKYGVVLFILIIFLLAYLEEGLWDGLVWNEHKRIFHIFSQPLLNPSHHLLSFIVPLLALPQITHYIIDGFIWKVKKS